MFRPLLSLAPLRSLLGCAAIALVSLPAHATVLRVEVGSTRGPSDVTTAVDSAVRQFAKNIRQLTSRERLGLTKRLGFAPQISLPVSVVLTRGGNDVPPPARTRGGGDPISLQFVSSGGRSFPNDYRAFLEAVFAKVQPSLDRAFGAPSIGGTVIVSNFDADLGDRDVVAGGAYFYDGAQNLQEIRFPIYSDSVGYKYEVAAVHFIHTLLLAYSGANRIGVDGWQEGLVRAATAQIVRTPGALPSGLDPVSLEQVLESSYEVGAGYDWCNQRALSGPEFIAPNLRDQALPIGGSTGGLYLLRYQMAGTAMGKLLAEYPSFAAEFNARSYANGDSSYDFARLNLIGQQAIDAIRGAGATVEGLPFAKWTTRQRILDGTRYAGPKLLVQPFAITADLQGTDFGVFGIQTHYFRTGTDGSEILLKDQSYPIYWAPDFTRFFAAAQDDRIAIVNGYGAVAPNFSGSAFAGEPYRTAVDVPVQDEISRVYLPAGAVATPGTVPNNLYGSVIGPVGNSATSYTLRITTGGTTVSTPILHGSFGVNLGASFEGTLSGIYLEVLRTTASDGTVVVATRTVNKTPGDLAVNLVIGTDGTVNHPFGWSAGVQMFGFLGEPYRPYLDGSSSPIPNDLISARWNPAKAKYDRNPEFSAQSIGQSFFLRVPAAHNVTYEGVVPTGVAQGCALRPGWNMVVNTLDQAVATTNMQFVTKTEFPRSFSDAAAAALLAPDLFGFLPGAPDDFSGVAETGSLLGTTSVQPGQAFFVKCFAADGGTLVLFPSDGRTRGRDGGPPLWELNVRLEADARSISARLAVGRNATRSFEPGRDSELPPAQGDVQIALDGSRRLYRDTRGTGRPETYQLTLENLVPGRKYKLFFEPVRGKQLIRVLDPSRKAMVFSGGGSYQFTAPSRTHRVRVMIPRVNS